MDNDYEQLKKFNFTFTAPISFETLRAEKVTIVLDETTSFSIQETGRSLANRIDSLDKIKEYLKRTT